MNLRIKFLYLILFLIISILFLLALRYFNKTLVRLGVFFGLLFGLLILNWLYPSPEQVYISYSLGMAIGTIVYMILYHKYK
uniref:Uncharacterized protein n=1 Tax=viral metagenome TaxID=1070528 RepID=A0A6C0LV09_9ZZZZ